jgi:hypothetical protein
MTMYIDNAHPHGDVVAQVMWWLSGDVVAQGGCGGSS